MFLANVKLLSEKGVQEQPFLYENYLKKLHKINDTSMHKVVTIESRNSANIYKTNHKILFNTFTIFVFSLKHFLRTQNGARECHRGGFVIPVVTDLVLFSYHELGHGEDQTWTRCGLISDQIWTSFGPETTLGLDFCLHLL